MDLNGRDDDIPENTTLANHQVAGHKSGKGILKHNDGYLLKPISFNEPRGIREKWFFDYVTEHRDKIELISTLSSFMPKYHGIWAHPTNEERRYLCLEDIADKFEVPCIMDVKIGAITYDPMATPDKILYEKTKYPYVDTVKFRILGMKVFDESKAEYFLLGRPFGKKLTPDAVLDALHMYLGKGTSNITSYILFGFIHHLKVIESWFKKQQRFGFFASSLLFLYEGRTAVWASSFPSLLVETLDINSAKSELKTAMVHLAKLEHSGISADTVHLNGKDNSEITRCEFCGVKRDICNKLRSENFVDVRMIDFAHVFLATEMDSNYLSGLHNLIRHFIELNKKIIGVE